MNIFEKKESNVRAYCRNLNDIITKAKDSYIYTKSGECYIDFLAGAGALNYGHNNDYIKNRIVDYINSDGISHGLDFYTSAKEEFIEKFNQKVLLPSGLKHKIMFCGPTGSNAVEAALKLARKVTGRTNIFSFMGGFHGMTMGSLSITGNREKRKGAGLPLNNVTFMPYPNGFMGTFDTIDYIENVLTDTHSGIDKPAAIIFETIQAEGGVIVATIEWMKRLRELCDKHDILLICDDIQVGCGRTSDFFSFQRAGIVPDMITISKSISGYGFPMSLLLLKQEHDIWKVAEHNGTFRGNQLAFIGASAALDYREESNLKKITIENSKIIEDFLYNEIKTEKIQIRGLGMIWGIDFNEMDKDGFTDRIIEKCYQNNLMIENVGRNGNVIKILPPLNIDKDILCKGLEILKNAIKDLI